MNKMTLNEPATRWSDRCRLALTTELFGSPCWFRRELFWVQFVLVTSLSISTEVVIEKRRISPYFHHKCMYPVSVHDVLVLLFSIKYERAKEVVSVGNNLSQRKTVSYIFYIIETMKGLIFTLILISTSAVSMAKGEVGEYCGQ